MSSVLQLQCAIETSHLFQKERARILVQHFNGMFLHQDAYHLIHSGGGSHRESLKVNLRVQNTYFHLYQVSPVSVGSQRNRLEKTRVFNILVLATREHYSYQ